MKSISRIPAALVVWITTYVFFICTLANNLSASHDSIHYLLDITRGNELFHQHHLLYNFLAAKWRMLFPGMAPHYAIESFTALWGSSALTVVYLFLRNRFYLLPFAAAAGTAITAFSYGVWFYSVNIEVYLPPLFFILCCLYIITKKTVSLDDVRAVAVLHSLAILFHQINILFTLVVIYMFITRRRKMAASGALIHYAAIGLVLAGGMYFVAGWVIEGHNSFPEWIAWMEGYTVGHGYWQPLSWRTPLHVATGFSHAFVGGHFIFQIPSVEQAMQRSFQDHGLADEIFLSSKISPALAWTLTLLTAAFLGFFIFLAVGFLRKYRSIINESGRIVEPLVFTIVVYSVFFCFWMPEILEFWILQTVLVWLLLIGLASRIKFPFRMRTRTGLVLMASLLFVINFFGSILWLQNINNDWYYNEVSKISGVVTSNDLVVVSNDWILKDFVRYYTPASVLATDEPGYNKEVEAALILETRKRHGKVFVYSDHRFTRSY